MGKIVVHAKRWDNHILKPLCGAQGPSHTMMEDIRFIDCPKCLEAINKDCPWCRGTGKYNEYGEIFPCGQCAGTGYANLEYHKREEE